jgi:hypothetical protein
MSCHYKIYRGIGGVGNINWQSPVANVPAGTTQAVLAGLGHEIGVDYWYGLRAVSQEGLEESNTHVLVCVELDPQGQLLPPPLARPEELTARVERDGTILLGLSHQVPPGFAAADVFDVFSDGGTGELDLQTPLTTVPNRFQSRADLEASLRATPLPMKLAVRARNGRRISPLSSTIIVAAEEPSPAMVVPI